MELPPRPEHLQRDQNSHCRSSAIDASLFLDDTPVVEQRRQPHYEDPHVVVPQFGRHVPQQLFDREFQDELQAKFPFVAPILGEFGEERYIAVLDFVETFLQLLTEPATV